MSRLKATNKNFEDKRKKKEAFKCSLFFFSCKHSSYPRSIHLKLHALSYLSSKYNWTHLTNFSFPFSSIRYLLHWSQGNAN